MAYYECDTCSYGVSGEEDSNGLNNLLDGYESENSGHRMVKVVED